MRLAAQALIVRSSNSLFSTPTTILKPAIELCLPVGFPQRHFVSNALTPLQNLHATRILPYHAPALYDLIADIQSYPQFIPYCVSSSITSFSASDPIIRKNWPRTATLRVGFGPYDELFHSAVYCKPHSVLEAVAGEAETTIPRKELPHYYDDPNHVPGSERSVGNQSIFTSLLTRWTFKEFPYKPPPTDGKSPQEGKAELPQNPSTPRTEVHLNLEVRFASAVYAALSQAAAPKIAPSMIEAFERRATEVLG